MPTAERSLSSSPLRFTFSWDICINATSLAHLVTFQGFSQAHGSIAATTLFIQPLPVTLHAIVILKDQLMFMMIMGGQTSSVGMGLASIRPTTP